ncbi:MAG TPA: hypothetical protein PKN91_00025 [Steroidobacteraceae bacterium]|nr:hypothetical protein [Steroidobacteraceae bacterium]
MDDGEGQSGSDAVRLFPRVVGLVLLSFVSATQVQAADPHVPAALQDWRGWVLTGEEHRACARLASPGVAAGSREARSCVWPGRLVLDVGARGGEFRQAWQVEADSWVALPGNADQWPRDVTIDGRRGAIVARNGIPHARLAPGEYQIAGRFEWTARPESLAVPAETGLVDLVVDGTRVAAPTRTGNTLLLGARQGVQQSVSFDFDVHRLLVDDIPLRLVTRLTLRATGGSREVLLGPVLPAGFAPIALDSPLPARVEADGRLRVQLRAGVFGIDLIARAVDGAAQVTRPSAAEPWPAEEIWSFAGDDRLRVAALEGGESIDPAQADVPAEWRAYPAMRVLQDTALGVVERSRGMASLDDNQLQVHRQLWLDFDHAGFTAVDQLRGSMRSGWRLDMAAPWSLGSARLDDVPLLVTRGQGEGTTGVELRSPELVLQTVARSAGARGALPATGWTTRFEAVNGELHVPPGHRLVAALGVDSAPDAWLERWGLWSLFGVVIIAAFVGWLAGKPAGVLAFAALALTYQDAPQVIWLWGNLLAALALARAAPEGRLRGFALRYRTISFAVLAIVLVPFMWSQLRLALHPQLDSAYSAGWNLPMPMPAARAPAAPPPPVMDMATARPEMAAVQEVKQETPEPRARKDVIATGAMASRTERYAPGTVVQAGPGIPTWQYRSYAYSWSGPVEPSQTARFVIAGPFVLAAWRVVGVLLLAALFAVLLAGSGPNWRERLPPRWRPWLTHAAARGTAPLAVALCFGVALVAGPSPAAAQLPDSQLLGELKARLTKPAECEPSCAELLAARVEVDPARLTLTIDAAALAHLAVPVPAAPGAWLLDSVTVDGTPSHALRRGGDEHLWVPLQPGTRTIVVSGRIASTDAVQLVFPWPPKRVVVAASGWEVAGVSDGRLPGGSLDLSRHTEAGARPVAGVDVAAEFPPFARVVRRFEIGAETRVETRVERVAPLRAAFSLPVPLLVGESVLTEDVEVRDGQTALAVLPAGAAAVGWASTLPRADSLTLTAPAADSRLVEVWEFDVDAQWHATFEGFVATLPEELGGEWVFEFHPRAGEQLTAKFERPVAAEGAPLAIEAVERTLSIGRRATDSTLAVRYRATQGGRHTVKLAPEARITSVTVDGEALALRPENGELSIPILPGEHTVTVSSTHASGVATIVKPEPLDLGAPASNVRTTLSLPANRWALFAAGDGVGPAILYWSELVAFLLTAWLVGRSGRSPLRTHEWVLLGLGLSTLSWGVLALVAIWLFAMKWREGWAGQVVRWQFNTVQVLLAVLTYWAVTALLFYGIRDGLLSTPDMGVTGPGSGGNRYSWFLDRTGGALPRPMVLSLPLWVFKSLVFVWAVWAAFAVLRWLRAAWNAWKSGGYWR